MKDIIIGLDFGNYCTVLSCVEKFDAATKVAGGVRTLMPHEQSQGIPSVYFYSRKRGTLLGNEAVSKHATPFSQRLRYLKRKLGESVVIEDRKIAIDDAVTEVIQHCMRLANEQLMNEYGRTSNLVSLAYPAVYTDEQRRKLIDLTEKATLADGTHVKVCHTIVAPAAAAIDYLEMHGRPDTETTVLAYDFGGGTFGLSLVKLYPEGRRDESGRLYYYDIISHDGLSNVGGIDFDNAMYELLLEKVDEELMGDALSEKVSNMLRDKEAEAAKIELTKFDVTYPEIIHDDEDLGIEVTREEFEEKTEHLLMKTIRLTRKMLGANPENKPDQIMITGGSSEMPMVEKALKRFFPEYEDKIVKHRPRRAIAFGAARFGATEKGCMSDVRPVEKSAQPAPCQGNGTGAMDESIVQPTLKVDIGVRVLDTKKNMRFIETWAPAGALLPYESPYHVSEITSDQQRFSFLPIYKANGKNPDPYNVDEDYTKIMNATVDYGEPLSKGSETQSRILIDKNGQIKIESQVTKKCDETSAPASQKKIDFDIGIRLFDPDKKMYFIETWAPAGTLLPYRSSWRYSETVENNQQISHLSVYKAKVKHPDLYNVEGDYTEIMRLIVDHGKPVPKGTEMKSKILINEEGLVSIESYNDEDERLSSYYSNETKI